MGRRMPMTNRIRAIRDEKLEIEELIHEREQWAKWCENCGKKISEATHVWIRRTYRYGDQDEEHFCGECITIKRDRRPPPGKRR